MKLTKNNGAKTGEKILQIGLLISIIFNIIALYRIYSLEDRMDFNYRWMIVKKIRAELIEKRLDIIEEKLKIKRSK